MCTCTTDVDAYSTNNKYSYCKLFSFKLLKILFHFFTHMCGYTCTVCMYDTCIRVHVPHVHCNTCSR